MQRILLIAGMCGLIVGCSKPLTNDQIIVETNKCIEQGFAAYNVKGVFTRETVKVECMFDPFFSRYSK